MASQDTFFRSSDMSLTQFYIANDIGREIVSALGEIGQVQFRDLNPDTNAFQRPFTKDIVRLDNVERQLRYFHSQITKASIPIRPSSDFANLLEAPLASEVDELVEHSEYLEQRIRALKDSYQTLKEREVELTQWRWVLRDAGGFFDLAHKNPDSVRQSFDNDDVPLLRDIEQHPSPTADRETQGQRGFSGLNIGFVAGVISRERIGALERVLWRTLRGNLYMNQSEIPRVSIDPTSDEEHKNVFLIFAHGKNVLTKVRKISESLGASLYEVDEDRELRRDRIHEVNTQLDDIGQVLQNTKGTLTAELSQIAKSLTHWMTVIKKEKAIYDILNQFSYHQTRKTLIAEAWCPTNSLNLIKSTLQDVDNRAGLSTPTVIIRVQADSATPPTYIRTNKFTEAFQAIVNAYRIPKYQEANPGLYTVVTFPFLFAVMFGDFGHGTLVTIISTAMIFWEQRLQRIKLNELFYMAFYGRYIMLMMGLFSIYTGLIYNDIFSRSFTIFPSQWQWPNDIKPGQTVEASLKEGYRYPIGLDWNWHEAENSLLFSNSMKMKMSILLGWAHMTYALSLQYVNGRHFKSKVDIWGNFIPAMLFYQSIFGYLVITVIYKWSVDWKGRGESPPSLLNMLIFMFLNPGAVDKQLYPYQGTVQVLLLLIAAVQVPIMLLFKPLYLRWEHMRAGDAGYRSLSELTDIGTPAGNSHIDEGTTETYNCMTSDGAGRVQCVHDDEDHKDFDFFDVMIHQIIHTIEFCLNCISHTASYLRLWALSLAHQQLSIVLWNMTLGAAFQAENPTIRPILIIINFYLWFTLSVSVLCVMEGTSAMLHSMRLHWIEAMSKHFIGEGIPFLPFSFRTILDEDNVD
ncbi:V-type proton ATPase subunit a [Aspergillus bombycis]|uniref:V-type proton ATPase subunit a n=1 Tax=Aspergillus bombycis TaxID=109264 RepID=A0A1F8AAS8_9EURO|nr:V-type proton ATPase subunit a [Aspergillus bombycis]OGM48822.1 V-type proton ATPase subunit a [Aspergillus bombycis]